MAVPKRKVSKARRDKRRSSVWKLEAPALVKCEQCGEAVLLADTVEKIERILHTVEKAAAEIAVVDFASSAA